MTAREAHTTSFALLRTKLHKPQARDDLVPRQRLVEGMNEGLDRKLTLVSAPAGSGKTTLLAQWLAECAHPVAWLSLDENDNDLTLFLSYIIAAIQTVFPEACPETSSLVRASQLPLGQVLVTSLVNEIAALPESLLLCLDDYHNIRTESVHQLIAELIENAPQQMHLVLATRVNPPFSLSRLHVNRQMQSIRMDDLRFTRDETRDNRLVVIPNGTIVDAEVVNYSQPDPTYRLQVDLGRHWREHPLG